MHTEVFAHNCGGMEWPCCICGQSHEQDLAGIRLIDDQGKNVGDVCPDCTKAGPLEAAEHMRAWAQAIREPRDEAAIREHAETLDELARQLTNAQPWATVEDLRKVEREQGVERE